MFERIFTFCLLFFIDMTFDVYYFHENSSVSKS